MARKGRRSTSEERVDAIRLLSRGYTHAAVAEIFEVTESSVYGWQKLYREGGLAALSTKIASGRKKLLSDKQLLQLAGWIRRDPRQLEFDFALWTRKMVRDLIRRKFGVDYSQQNVGRILKMLGFSPQRPVYQALERDQEKRRIWMQETFPAIRKRAEKEGARIYFADEAGCRTDHHAGTTWAPVGQTPVVTGTGKRQSVGMVSAISMRGAMHWMVFEGMMNSELFTEYLGRLIHDIKGKIFLIVDGAGYHKSNKTREWVGSKKNRIELFFLPPYSPDLNPDEWVWKNVKNDQIARVVPTSRDHLFDIAERALRLLRTAPGKIRSFFADPKLAYIRRSAACV